MLVDYGVCRGVRMWSHSSYDEICQMLKQPKHGKQLESIDDVVQQG